MYDPERPALTPLVGATLSGGTMLVRRGGGGAARATSMTEREREDEAWFAAATPEARRAREFDWGRRTPEWWLSDAMHCFKERVDYPMEMYSDLLSTAQADAARVEAVGRHVNAVAMALGRVLRRGDEERYTKMRVVEVFTDEVEAAEAAGDRAGRRAMTRALDEAFWARALEQRLSLAAMLRALPREAPESGVEVWRASPQ